MKTIRTGTSVTGLAKFTKWEFSPTGDYVEDCEAGRRLGRDYLAFQDDEMFSPALGWIVQSIASLGRPLSGIEIGFFHELNTYLGDASVSDSRPPLRLIQGGKQ